MIKNRTEILITIILLIIFTGLLCFNYLSYREFEKRTQARIERHNALEAQQQERIAAREATRGFIRMRELARNLEIRQIIGFDEVYSAIKQDYLAEIDRISDELEGKVINIDDIIILVDERIDASRRFRSSLDGIGDVPGPLEDFYDLLMEFLENDISTWQEIRSYYAGIYNGDDRSLRESYNENSRLFMQVNDMQKDIYSEYNLEDLL